MAQQLMDLLGGTRLEIDHVLGLRPSHNADPKSPPLSAA
jgi:hypothetical protein